MLYSYLPNKIIAETDNEFGVNLDKFIIQKIFIGLDGRILPQYTYSA